MATETAAVKVGDVFYSSWGYDQTNVNFFAVVALSKTGKTATFVELAKASAGSGRVTSGTAALCRHCGNGVRKLVRVDGSSVYRHVATGETECKFYGYRAERMAEEGKVCHAAVDEFKRRIRYFGTRVAANWTDYASMYRDDEQDSHYETPAGAGH